MVIEERKESVKVLLLNKSYHPLRMISKRKSLKLIAKNKAEIVDTDFTVRNLEEWIENWEDADEILKAGYSVSSISSQLMAFPKVIKLKEYNGGYDRVYALLNRKNVFLRDKNKCQYCGKENNKKITFNIDHVTPKGQGGKTRWENVVISCMPCNQKKGCRTPEEADMKLLNNPKRPKWYELEEESLKKDFIPWKDLFSGIYWNIELE